QAADDKGKYQPLAPLATKGVSHNDCERLLSGEFSGNRSHRLVFSGRDEDVAGKLTEYADLLFAPGGLGEKLGLSSTHQIIQFLPGSEVNAVTANGRMPVGHWSEGAKIVKGDRGGGLIYEMVVSGGMIRHSIYRDDLPWKKQFSILNHVMGHVHFGVHTVFRQSRTIETNQAAYNFDAMMTDFKNKYDPDEVSEWYQYLLSLEWSQDMIGGTYNTVDDFRVKPQDYARKKGANLFSNPKAPTANIMQAFVANLPPHTPPWKREMAEEFAKLTAYISGAINTKVMNEGFATLMQELLPSHTPYNTFDHYAEYCCLLSGVVPKSLGNPYWLGLEAWRNIRKRFSARPENKGLSQFELDERFIAYATKEIIEKMDDKMFLRFGLEDNWLQRQNLVLTRRLPPADWDPSLPPPRPGQFKEPTQYEIVTRDPKRIRESIIMNVKGFEFQMPKPVLTNLASDGSGIIQMEISDQVGRELSLKKRSMVQTQLVMARVMQAPISLESTIIQVLDQQGDPISPWILKWWLQWRTLQELINEGEIQVSKDRHRVVVYPSGEVRAFKVLRNGNANVSSLKIDHFERADDYNVKVELVEVKPLAEELQIFSDQFQADLDLGKDALNSLNRETTMTRLNRAVADAVNGVPPGLLLHIPTVPNAINEYWNFANRRKVDALRRAIEHGQGLHQNKNSVAVKVFPDIPGFQFTKMSLNLWAGSLPVPMASNFAGLATGSMNTFRLMKPKKQNLQVHDRLSEDIPLDIDEDGGGEGKKIWHEGDGEPEDGDGDDDGEPRDPRDPGQDAGIDPNDPTFMEFDLDLYATMLEDYITLPQLRPLDGASRNFKDVRAGWAYRRSGSRDLGKVARKAVARGVAYYKSKGIVEKNPMRIIQKGFTLLEGRDIIVKDYTPQPEPDVNAVVFVKMDLSGSYTGFVKRTKQMLFDMRALLLHKYKKVKFVFIGFDGQAVATEDLDEFLKLQLGGGTDYATAFKKTIELFSQYPINKWDRFSVLAGDFEDFDTEPNMEGVLDEMRQGVRFMAGVRMAYRTGSGQARVEDLYRHWSSDDPYVSFVDLAPDNEYSPLTLRQIFKNDQAE
ncbi:MAG: SpoVR family protein, partial [Bdellovibrionales bacterium]